MYLVLAGVRSAGAGQRHLHASPHPIVLRSESPPLPLGGGGGGDASPVVQWLYGQVHANLLGHQINVAHTVSIAAEQVLLAYVTDVLDRVMDVVEAGNVVQAYHMEHALGAAAVGVFFGLDSDSSTSNQSASSESDGDYETWDHYEEDDYPLGAFSDDA